MYIYICIYISTLYIHIDYELSRTPKTKTIFNMDQVNTILSKKGSSPIEACVFFVNFYFVKMLRVAHCMVSSHPCAPQELGSNSSLELNLSPDHFLHTCPKLQPCFWKEAEAAYAAAVPEEAYASGLHMDHHGRYGVLSDTDFDLSPVYTYFRRQHLK